MGWASWHHGLEVESAEGGGTSDVEEVRKGMVIVGWKGRDEPQGIDTQYVRLLSREVIPELEWWSVTRLRGEKWRDEGGRQGYMRHIWDSWKYVSRDRSGTEQKSRVSSSTAELPLQCKCEWGVRNGDFSIEKGKERKMLLNHYRCPYKHRKKKGCIW